MSRSIGWGLTEAGIETSYLDGSTRDGKANLKDSYVIVKGDEAFLLGTHVSPYSHGNLQNHEPVRRRRERADPARVVAARRVVGEVEVDH